MIEPKYRWACDFSEGLAQVLMVKVIDEKKEQYEFKTGYIDKSSKMVIKPQFDFDSNKESPFSQGIACVSINGKWGCIDKSGKFVVEPKFDAASNFSEGLAGVKVDEKWGFIDKSEKFVIKPQFAYWVPPVFSEGLVQVKIDNKWGYMDKSGKIVIKPKFDWSQNFSNGLAYVTIGSFPIKYAYIDKNGKIIWETE